MSSQTTLFTDLRTRNPETFRCSSPPPAAPGNQEGGFYHNFRPLQREYDGHAGGESLPCTVPNGQEMICFVSTDFISSNQMVFWSFPADFLEGLHSAPAGIVRIIFYIPLKEGLTMRREMAK
jgi:hypothetical protein